MLTMGRGASLSARKMSTNCRAKSWGMAFVRPGLALARTVTVKLSFGTRRKKRERFPKDFMFQLTRHETQMLNRSQYVTGPHRHRDPRFSPFAFTEHGALMAANILNSPRAVAMSVYVIRAFVKIRENRQKPAASRHRPPRHLSKASTSAGAAARTRTCQARNRLPRQRGFYPVSN